MLVAVLIPLMVMVLAVLLERFEARAVPGEPARTTQRATRAALPATERPRHLSLVPDTGDDADVDRAPDPALDPQTLRLTLPRAS